MSSVPDQYDDTAGSGAPPSVPWWNAASPVGGDVVLSGAVLLFMAVAFAFVLYHYFTVSGRRGERAGVAARVPSSGHQRARRGTVSDAAGGGVSSAVLRALPLTVYSAKDREALECAVCLTEVADGEPARFLPKCGHGFHAECVDLWLRGHSTCPLCRVDVAKTDAPMGLALPPALPEPANYPRTNLPTNVLFWGSQNAVATGVVGGARSLGGAPAALVIEVREDRETASDGGAAKPMGFARLSSIRRLWNRGSHHQETGASSSRSCRRATARGDRAERALPSPLDIWNVT
ncbi:hypothetical protein PR202_gb15545 [Eleusine coracana subsp. coracana]|uniref:RING-type E3 ubiquitin transferase n=1 Tax=Eleusine coracana subsp. coracana TaxID=191504 RepID=A0AAV5EXX1_ELECO|nr:hypothetical protein QOZ80_4BG0347510 [Eleusine coracana subsp. coracana]GJN27515.1 hypothetical protein PR202_gb15545 [Eleusine coracana subsp. coracana]